MASRDSRLALGLAVTLALALCAETSAAQTAPASPIEERIDQLTRELEAQRQALAAQKAEQEAQRQAAEAEKAELKARLDKVEAQAQAAEAQAADARTQSELAGLMGGQEEELAPEPLVRVYGFADVGLQRAWGPIASLVPGGTTKTTFVLGNVNLYFDANPIPDWRFLSEVRFGLFPHGATDRSVSGVAPAIDNTISDDAASGAFTTIAWNGVVLERAHIDWEPRDELNIRAGLFLTPYGIYNVDHGSPTRIMIEPPVMIATEAIPQRQVGVEVFGRFHVLPWTLGYHLYISNGRQPGHLDYQDDKAVGGRLWAQTRRPVPVTFGLSGYTGHYEKVQKSIGLRADGNFDVTEEETLAYRDYGLGADASVDIDSLRLRAEGLARWQIFDDGKRPSNVPGTTRADSMTLGTYLLAAYRLPWLGLEPLAQFDLLRFNVELGEYIARSSVGLNIYFDPAVVLRFNYFHSRFFDLEGPARSLKYDYFNSVAARLSIAF
jgi:hypothetical protein